MNESKIVKEYEEKFESISSLAKKYDTYPNKIRRILLRHGKKLRDPSTAQKIALESGRAQHPTEGRKRTQEEKINIGQGVSNNFKNLSDEEKEKISKKHKRYWKNLGKKEKEKSLKK